MDMTLLFGEYFVWHYGKSVRDFLIILRNMLWFGYHFFSMRLLARTFLAPYKRFHQQYDWGHLELGALGQDILLNLFMRMLGMALRSFVLVAGLVFEILVLAAGIVAVAIWLLLPAIAVFLALSGVFLLFG